jgi:hypothetical protein
MDDGFRLSPANPLATVDQRAVEDRALGLIRRPELERARAAANLLFRNGLAHAARDQMSAFEAMVDEYVFHHALRAANGDAAHPKIVRFMAPPHHWFGRDVPGSRWAGDSPDFVYRMIPIAHGGRYRIIGRATCARPPTVNYSLMSDAKAAPVTLVLLDSLDMAIDAGGGFEITVDDSPPEGRPNHIQTRAGADHLMIRDALGDWIAQTPNDLRVVRLDAPQTATPTDEALAARAARNLLEGLYYTYYCMMSGSGQPPNELRPPQSAGAFGGMATQWGTKGNLVLEDDEAFVVTTNAAGARFRNVTLTSLFHLSIDYGSQTSSLNMDQMAADADGRFTYVVAHRDPGVHNWLDTGGLRRTIFGHRWQAFPRGVAHETPTLAARTVRLADLEAALPSGVARIDAAGRRTQLADRARGVRQRFLDH